LILAQYDKTNDFNGKKLDDKSTQPTFLEDKNKIRKNLYLNWSQSMDKAFDEFCGRKKPPEEMYMSFCFFLRC
jgi:hypothetical protein